MKNILYLITLICFLPFWHNTLSAQTDTVIVTLDFDNAAEDPLIDGAYLIPLTVQNYNSVSGYQIEVMLNTSAASFVEDGFENSLFEPPSFATNITNGDRLITTYLGLAGDPTNTLEDGTVLFDVHVLLDGEPGDCFDFEIIRSDIVASNGVDELPSKTVDGEFCILAFINVSGNVNGPEGSPLSGVIVQLATADSTYTDTTNLNGTFLLNGVDAGAPFELTPIGRVGETEQANRIAGLNVADAIALRRHILQLAPLDDPLALLATDVVADEVINILDLVSLTNYILLRTDVLPTTAYYRFLPAGFIFNDSANPWLDNPPSSIQSEGSNEDLNNLDFTGLKYGDVNSSSY